MEGRDVPHYGFLDELRLSLSGEPDAATILKATGAAVNSYNPESEAVVFDERAEGVVILIVGAAETRVVAESYWTKPT